VLEGLYGKTDAVVYAAMGGVTARTLAVNENLANIDTPFYKRKQVEFETQLQRFRRRHDNRDQDMAVTSSMHFGIADLATTHAAHFDVGPWSASEIKPASWRADGTSFRNDGNNVDVDYEMTVLAQSEMTYNTLATFMRDRFEGLKAVIRGT